MSLQEPVARSTRVVQRGKLCLHLNSVLLQLAVMIHRSDWNAADHDRLRKHLSHHRDLAVHLAIGPRWTAIGLAVGRSDAR